MDAKEIIARRIEIIARRIALELTSGDLVNLGIGLPTAVASYVPHGVEVFFQAENGLIGMQSLPDPGLADENLSDPGGSFVGAVPGACSFDSCMPPVRSTRAATACSCGSAASSRALTISAMFRSPPAAGC